MIKNGLECFLIFVCTIFLYFIKALDWLHTLIMKIFSFLLVIGLLYVVDILIHVSPPEWQSIILMVILYGVALSSLCFISLSIWKPEKMTNLLMIFEKRR